MFEKYWNMRKSGWKRKKKRGGLDDLRMD